MRRRLVPIIAAVFLFLLLSPQWALALSLKWPTEGSYVHQTAHLFFAAAMLFFIRQIYQAGLSRFPGFRLLVWCWALLALWNVDAFIGHWADWTLSNPIILGRGFSRDLLMYDSHTWLVYITKIDHFLFLAPAFYLFYRGLKTLVRNSEAESP